MKLVLPDGTTYQSPEASRKLYRVLHDHELPRGAWRVGLPEVFVLNSEQTPFGADWQRLAFAMNPGMDPAKFRVLYDDHRAFTNGTGFSDTDPRADYVNGLDLASPLPKWDKTRVCGGATITGTVEGAYLIVDIMDGRGPAPKLEELKEWQFFRAINAGTLSNFPQGGGLPVYIPLVGSGIAKYPLAGLEEL